MPLVKPETKSDLSSILWKIIRTSDFLIGEKDKTKGKEYRIRLSHFNGCIVAIAHSQEEFDNLWETCIHIAEIGKTGSRLVSTFESFWKEYEEKETLIENNDKTLKHENQSQKQNLLFQLKQLLLNNNNNDIDYNNIYLVRALEDCFINEDGFIRFHENDLLLVSSYKLDKNLYYAQNLNEFGLLLRSSVGIIEKIDLFNNNTNNVNDNNLLTSNINDNIKYLEGYLEKRGFWFSKDWKRRYFSLNIIHERLYYYVNSNDIECNNYRGFIDLKEITTVHESYAPDSHYSEIYWPFEIHTPQRVWYLRSNRKQEMEIWIYKINEFAIEWNKKQDITNIFHEHRIKVLQGDISLQTSIKPGININPSTSIDLRTSKSEIDTIRKTYCVEESLKQQNEPIILPDNDFSKFGAPDGEEIRNKSTILQEIDRKLGYKNPPDIEYIYVEPYLNYASKNIYVATNPYGHALVRYTMPDTKEQMVMNIVGLADHELVNFLHPEDLFFSTNFNTKLGNEQGGIYNRNFVSIRVQRVPPEKIIAMHQYFLDLHARSHRNWADYNILLGPILNRASNVSYGNCAHWSSQGLIQAGLLKNTSMFPKSIWIDLFEQLKVNCQQEHLSKNISVVYYKRVQHAKRFYGENADWSGWSRIQIKGKTYDNLEKYADIIVSVPKDSKTAIVQTGNNSTNVLLYKQVQQLKYAGKSALEFRFDFHVPIRTLFNEIFYTRFNATTLKKTPIHNQLNTIETIPYKRIHCGYPILSNCWLVDNNNQLYKIKSKSQNIKDLEWQPIDPPIINNNITNDNLEYSQVAPGEDGSCWIVYGNYLFYRLISGNSWTQVNLPSTVNIHQITTIGMIDGLWCLDYNKILYHWTIESQEWIKINAPKLHFISIGKHEELWGITNDNNVYRYIKIHKNEKKWIQLHGALLNSIAVASSNEVWGLDKQGRVFIWSNSASNEEHSSDIEDLNIKPQMSWQSLGNILPFSSISINTENIPWGITNVDPGYIYKLSQHRLLVLTTKSSRKIWDDRNTDTKPYNIGFWRPLPPKQFYSLGDIAERSHLENASTESLVVCEVGLNEDEIAILAPPIGFKLIWRFLGNSIHYSNCYIWKPIPPNDYIALGHIVTSEDVKPNIDSIRCVHKNFLNQSTPCKLDKNHEYLWLSPSNEYVSSLSIWLVTPRLDSLWCNIFLCSKGKEPPLDRNAMCLKLAATN